MQTLLTVATITLLTFGTAQAKHFSDVGPESLFYDYNSGADANEHPAVVKQSPKQKPMPVMRAKTITCACADELDNQHTDIVPAALLY